MNYIGYVTHPKIEGAKELARKLVENKLVACVNIVPKVISVYTWKGKIENDEEVLMIMKTNQMRTQEVIEFVKKNHPYDVPEVIFTEIKTGSSDYLSWIVESTKK